jgi:predicted Rdx family selenoprotein
MTQPVNAGAPQPVQGVTGGPGLPQGVASVDGSTGNVVISPPNNTIQFRKTDSPQALQVYEYFHTNADFSRISLNAQTGGPFQIAVETAPPAVVRGLQINAGGTVFVNALSMRINTDTEITGNLLVDGATIQLANAASSFSWGNGAGLSTDVNRVYITPPTGGTHQVFINGVLAIGNPFVLTATAGSATALPAAPALYFQVVDQSGVARLIPAYNP